MLQGRALSHGRAPSACPQRLRFYRLAAVACVPSDPTARCRLCGYVYYLEKMATHEAVCSSKPKRSYLLDYQRYQSTSLLQTCSHHLSTSPRFRLAAFVSQSHLIPARFSRVYPCAPPAAPAYPPPHEPVEFYPVHSLVASPACGQRG